MTTDEAALDAAVRRLRHHGWATLGDMPTPGLQLPPPGHPLRDRDPAAGPARGAPRARASASRAGTRNASSTIVLTPSAAEGDRHGWQAYVVQLEPRDEALAALREAGIEAQIGTWALHRLEPYREQGEFPGADRAFERALALPFATTTTEAGGRASRACLDLVVSE